MVFISDIIAQKDWNDLGKNLVKIINQFTFVIKFI